MPVSNLQDAKEILEKIPANDEFTIRFYGSRDPFNDSLAIVKNERNWHEANYCSPKNDVWLCEALLPAPPAEPEQ